MGEVSIAIAFSAGVISFLAPCVLPLIPGFLVYLASPRESASGAAPSRKDIFINSVFFVLGFSLVFAALGVALNTLLSHIAYDAQIWLGRVGGLIIIFFGLYLAGLLRFSFLEKEHKLKITKSSRSRYLTSFLFGLAFAAGWTPCVGAALGAILGLAATQPGIAFYLLLAYALGLGLPFLVIGLFAGEATKFLNRLSGKIKVINIVFGILLIALGILIFTGNLSRISNFELLNQFLLTET